MGRSVRGLGLLLIAVPAFAGAWLPQYDHVVVVMMSTHSPDTIVGNASAPYINGTLLALGASFGNSQAPYAPDQPNYIALLAGDNLGATSNTCPITYTTTGTLPRQLLTANLSFADFAEDLPAAGDTSCMSGNYVRTHNPVTAFTDLPPGMNLPYSDFSTALSGNTLPTVSFVIPNVCNDMHGSSSSCMPVFTDLVSLGDQWLSNNVPAILAAAAAQRILLIVTWDIGDASISGYSLQIPTIFVGPKVKAGYTSSAAVTHLATLRLIEDLYGLPPLLGAATATQITDVFDDTIFADSFEGS